MSMIHLLSRRSPLSTVSTLATFTTLNTLNILASPSTPSRRSFIAHRYDVFPQSCGRSVPITDRKSAITAYMQLRDIMDQDNLRKVVRSQLEFEKPHDKRRRKDTEAQIRLFVGHIRKQVDLAKKLEQKYVWISLYFCCFSCRCLDSAREAMMVTRLSR